MIDIKAIIGIISRGFYTDSNRKINIVYDDIFSSVIKSGGIPIGIPRNTDISLYLDICDGFILQGGDDIDEYNLCTIKLLKEKNKHVLGICLGMQEMFYDDNMIDIDNHRISGFHEVNVLKDTLLYNIVGKDKILVNSRHKSAIKDTKYIVSGRSEDGIIEAIEVPEHKFFLGLQWHPENIYDVSVDARKIFDYFIEICNN